MIETLQHMSYLLTLPNFLVLLIGSIGGIFFGAMPGLSPTMAVALLVPFTFYMDAGTGLILLGSVYTSAVAGGAITAVLINIPGAPASIATMLDGHPMAKKGEGQQALYIAFIGSLIGGVCGVLALILLTPPLAAFAMRFGPSELFWVSVFGITVIAGLSEGKVIRGLYGGVLGMLISCIGYSPMLGAPRFIFHDIFTGGIAIVPALIGLFAIPQVLELAEDVHLQATKNKYEPKKGLFWPTIKNFRKWWRTTVLANIVGIIIGIIPGAGGQVAGLITYDQAKKISSHPETFGTGEPEGLVASEVSNNATVGAALIPLLTLGIPGSPTAAVLLGGLLIHGLFPGPELFTKHANVAYTFIAGMMVAQFFMCGVGLLFSRYSHTIMNISNLMMMASVTVLACIGTYCVQNSMDDVIVMFLLGLLMYLGGKSGFPSAPVVLGIILGPIAEENFLRGKMIAETDVGVFSYFFTGGISIFLIALSVLSLAWGLFARHTRRNALPEPMPTPKAHIFNKTARKEWFCILGMLAVIAVFYSRLPGGGEQGAAIFPGLMLALLLCLTVVKAVTEVLHPKTEPDTAPVPFPWARILFVLAATAVYIAAIEPVGFYLSSFLFFFLTTVAIQAVPRTPKSLGIRAATVFACLLFLYGLFTVLLQVQIPKGLLV
ncbi:MAG: tripartite tricarboxylate transporter permease [Desulfovibrio sp.]|jgi:putative tricarboxylic transport membrane protein|nr:tripartite tricarboxylate transporter permease [Desulfovibrio sp.]